MRVLTGSLVLGLLTSIASCGSSGGSASCGTFAACGGDVTGGWSIDQACFGDTLASAGDDLKSGCAAATVDTSGVNVTGSATFKSDKTYSTTLGITGSMKMTLPASCLTGNGVTLTCAQLQGAIMDSLKKNPDQTFDMVTCTGSSSCTCTMHFKPAPQDESGTWSTSGNVLSTKATGSSTADTAEYCVKGSSELDVAGTLDMPMGMMGAMMKTRAYFIAHRK